MQTSLLAVPLSAQGEWLDVRIYWRSCSAAMETGRVPHPGAKKSKGLSCTHLDPSHGHDTPSVACSAPVRLFKEQVDRSTDCTL